MTQIFDPPAIYATRKTGSLIVITGSMFSASAPTILVGAEEGYEARCRHCHEVPEGVFHYGFPGI